MKNAYWGASLEHFRSVSFLLLFLSDASSVSGRTFPAVRYGGRLSGLWRDQQSPLYAGSHTSALSSSLWKEKWRLSQQNCRPHTVGQTRTSSVNGLVAAGKGCCTSTCLLFMTPCALQFQEMMTVTSVTPHTSPLSFFNHFIRVVTIPSASFDCKIFTFSTLLGVFFNDFRSFHQFVPINRLHR